MRKQQEVIKFITKQTTKVNNAWIRGLIQGIPSVGSTLDTWIFQFSEQEKQKRVEEQFKILQKQIEKLEIDAEYVTKHQAEFGYLFERAIVLIAQDYRKEIREAYRIMLTNFLTKGFSRLDNKELYLQSLSTMSPIHLVTLKVFKETMNEDGKLTVQPEESKKFVTDMLLKRGVEEPLAEALINDLVARGMVSHVQSSVIGGDLHLYSITSLGEEMLSLIGEIK